jgi:hypothetical protein
MERNQLFRGPFSLRILNPHTGLLSYPPTDKKQSESRGVSLRKRRCAGGGDSEAREAGERPDRPLCSQSPHDKAVVARCAQ